MYKKFKASDAKRFSQWCSIIDSNAFYETLYQLEVNSKAGTDQNGIIQA